MNPRIAITLFLIMLFALGANAQDSDEFFSLEVLTPSATIQACQTQDFIIEVGNFGSFIETYELSIDSFLDGATFSENPITLTPQETRQVTISVTPDCNVYGLHNIVFTLENVALGSLYEDFFCA